MNTESSSEVQRCQKHRVSNQAHKKLIATRFLYIKLLLRLDRSCRREVALKHVIKHLQIISATVSVQSAAIECVEPTCVEIMNCDAFDDYECIGSTPRCASCSYPATAIAPMPLLVPIQQIQFEQEVLVNPHVLFCDDLALRSPHVHPLLRASVAHGQFVQTVRQVQVQEEPSREKAEEQSAGLLMLAEAVTRESHPQS